MVSVMLLTISLMTVAILVVKSASREMTETNAHVARERALMAAHASADLAIAQIRADIEANTAADVSAVVDPLLVGTAGSKDCSQKPSTGDCIPGAGAGNPTGQRYAELNNRSDCGGMPCMRPGAVVQLDLPIGPAQRWVDLPLRTLLPGSDPEAVVTVWLRNNALDALDTGGSGDWRVDSDARVVVTASATVRHTTVVVEKEIMFGGGNAPAPAPQRTADEGYGGGHNNDNSSVSVCATNGVGITTTK